MADRSGKVPTLRFLDAPANFRKISFSIRALLLWEKAMTGEKKQDDENNGHHVIPSSQLPERWLTGTPHARAKNWIFSTSSFPILLSSWCKKKHKDEGWTYMGSAATMT